GSGSRRAARAPAAAVGGRRPGGARHDGVSGDRMRGVISAGYVEIVAHVPAAREHHFLTLAAPEIASAAQPGQFAMLRVPGAYDPLLPRAFSFFGADARAGQVTFLYRVVGKGTRLLAAQRPGSRLQIWGPLGRGFEP